MNAQLVLGRAVPLVESRALPGLKSETGGTQHQLEG
jgi:hypothetical protein